MKKFTLTEGPIVFGHVFYTTAMVYDRREQVPFPPVNIYFCDDKVLVQALVPGLELEDIRMSLEQDFLLLEGCIMRHEGHYIHEERYSGRFRRKIPLSTPVFSHARARLRNGILQIEFQRRK